MLTFAPRSPTSGKTQPQGPCARAGAARTTARTMTVVAASITFVATRLVDEAPCPASGWRMRNKCLRSSQSVAIGGRWRRIDSNEARGRDRCCRLGARQLWGRWGARGDPRRREGTSARLQGRPVHGRSLSNAEFHQVRQNRVGGVDRDSSGAADRCDRGQSGEDEANRTSCRQGPALGGVSTAGGNNRRPA